MFFKEHCKVLIKLKFMESFLEILKYSIPAIIVFATVFYLFRSFLQQQYQLEALKYRQNVGKDLIPLKLQAYERLMLFCERISVDHLAYRLGHPDMGAYDLKSAMMIAIQQEYEHNVSQQVYVSENLWKIIQLAKEQMQAVISESEGTTAAEVVANTKKVFSESKADPVAYAKSAVRSEAQLLM